MISTFSHHSAMTPLRAFTCLKLTMETPRKICLKWTNKDTRTTSMTSFWCLYCWLWTDFTHYSGVSIAVLKMEMLVSLRYFLRYWKLVNKNLNLTFFVILGLETKGLEASPRRDFIYNFIFYLPVKNHIVS